MENVASELGIGRYRYADSLGQSSASVNEKITRKRNVTESSSDEWSYEKVAVELRISKNAYDSKKKTKKKTKKKDIFGER